MFARYRFTDPDTERSLFVEHWSYLWAGVFGAAYVLYKGMGAGRFLYAAIINILFALVVVAATFVTSLRFVPVNAQAVALVAMIPVIIAIQGTVMIRIVRDGYVRRGWRVKRNE